MTEATIELSISSSSLKGYQVGNDAPSLSFGTNDIVPSLSPPTEADPQRDRKKKRVELLTPKI